MTIKLEQIRLQRLNELRIHLSKALEKSSDLSPVFNNFKDRFYQVIEQNWGMSGTMFGLRWKELSPKYKQWKIKHYGNGKANLILTGRLKAAATGKSNESNVKIEKLKMRIGINNIPYAQIHQEGGWTGRANMPQRPYFFMKDGTIHPRLERFLKEELNRFFEKEVCK